MTAELKTRHYAIGSLALGLGYIAFKLFGIPIVGPLLAWPFGIAAMAMIGALILRQLVAKAATLSHKPAT